MKTLILCLLTAPLFASNPPDSVVVSIQSIKAANSIKIAMDETKILVDSMTVQISDLKSEILNHNLQKTGFKKIIENRQNALAKSTTENYELDLENRSLTAKLARKNKTIFIVAGIALIETFGIWLLVK